jgi:hypothetical protein
MPYIPLNYTIVTVPLTHIASGRDLVPLRVITPIGALNHPWVIGTVVHEIGVALGYKYDDLDSEGGDGGSPVVM